jgi:hypothetical protein
VPEPSESQQKALLDLQKQIRAQMGKPGSSQEALGALSETFMSIATVPPEEAVVKDFASDLAGALVDAALDDHTTRQLTQSLYVVMNSAALSNAELHSLQKDIGDLLQGSGGNKDRVKTVLFDIQAINEAIKEPGSEVEMRI